MPLPCMQPGPGHIKDPDRAPQRGRGKGGGTGATESPNSQGVGQQPMDVLGFSSPKAMVCETPQREGGDVRAGVGTPGGRTLC